MKLVRRISLIALFVSSMNLFAQTKYTTEYEVQYEVTYSMDSLNLDAKRNETIFLYTGPEYGVFLNYNEANAALIKEEMQRQVKSGHIDMTGLIKPTEFPKQFYKDKQADQVLVTSKIKGENISYIEESVPLVWEITEETKEFMGYQTQKATTSFGGRDYEAWFTFEVPISDGPYIFYGLPGLIVELYDTQKHYNFEMSSLQKLEESKVWEAPKALEMTKQKYLEGVALQAKDTSIGAMMSNTGISIGGSAPSGAEVRTSVVVQDASGREISEADFKRMRRKSMQSKNNPIELK